MLSDLFKKLIVSAAQRPEDQVEIELVFSEPRLPDDVGSIIKNALPDAVVSVEPLLSDEAQADSNLLVVFPEASVSGQSADVFALARALLEEVSALEANPIMPDSLMGGAAVVDEVDESVFGRLCQTDRDDTLPLGWAHDIIDTPAAWQETRGSGARVAVIDTGYSHHPELADAIHAQAGWNFVEGNNDATDRFSTDVRFASPGHGTLVCSVVASRGGIDAAFETTGPGKVTGSAPDADIVPIRAIRSVIDFKQSRIPRAIRHAVDAECDVIAMALGGPTRVGAVEKALRHAVENGLIIVCAAGNCWPFVVFPAAYSRQGLAVAVAALQDDLKPWAKTGKGRAVTVSAPGENVWGASMPSSNSEGEVNPVQGTTLATSLTAGLAALWVSKHGGRAALKAIADSKGSTVQDLFMQALTHGLEKPDAWEGSERLGAGVVNAKSLLAFDLTSVPAREGLASSDGMSVPTVEILAQHLDDASDGAASVPNDAAPFAAELLWLSFHAGARQRAEEEAVDGISITAPVPSQAAEAFLNANPDVAKLVLR